MFKELFTEGIDKRMKISGLSVEIHYQPPRGYVAIGKSPEIKKVIKKRYFESRYDAIENATLEIKCYLD